MAFEPLADLWVELSEPDAHVNMRLDVLGPDGEPLPNATVHGRRSARHLEPLEDGRFVQAHGIAPPTGRPPRVPVRLWPIDFVARAGSRVRLTVAGSTFNGSPSLGLGKVEILHDCEHPSALRFEMPRPDATQLNVREAHEQGPLPDNPAEPLVIDGGGIATADVCGRPPDTNRAPGQ